VAVTRRAVVDGRLELSHRPDSGLRIGCEQIGPTSGIVRTADKAGDLCQDGRMEGKPYHPQKCLNVFGALLRRPGVLPTMNPNRRLPAARHETGEC
jgi:hypothetical protein